MTGRAREPPSRAERSHPRWWWRWLWRLQAAAVLRATVSCAREGWGRGSVERRKFSHGRAGARVADPEAGFGVHLTSMYLWMAWLSFPVCSWCCTSNGVCDKEASLSCNYPEGINMMKAHKNERHG